MKKTRIARMAAAGFLALTATAAIPLISGCKAESEMSKEEQENFKGGPMPADYNPNAPASPPAAGGGAAAAPPAGAPPGPAGAGAGATGR